MVNRTDSRDRRRFLARAITTIHAAIGGTLGVILGGSILAPGFARRRESWLPAGTLNALPTDEPTPVAIRVEREDGYAQIIDRQVVFLVKTGDGQVTALSSTCTHLGCRVSWAAEAQELRCPCHGGVFDKSGSVRAGPPPEPLARLLTKIDGNRILIQI